MNGVRVKEILSLNYKEGEKVKISPVGEITGYDGRTFTINSKEIIENLTKNALDIPLDINHEFGVAVGWFSYKGFEVRDDGIYATLELNKQGHALISEKSYRYLSPVYEQNNKHEVVNIDSVGLVNRPNLLNNALNQKGDGVDKDKKIEELEAELKDTKTQLDELKGKLEENSSTSLTDQKKSDSEKKEDASSGEQKNDGEQNQKQNEEIAALKKQLLDMNSKLEDTNKKLDVFKQGEYEPNKKEDLSENEKNVAQLLGLSDDEYKGGK